MHSQRSKNIANIAAAKWRREKVENIPTEVDAAICNVTKNVDDLSERGSKDKLEEKRRYKNSESVCAES